MRDRTLAGSVIPAGTFNPNQLWAGESHQQGGTTQGIVAAGQVLGAIDNTGHTSKWPVVALVGGKLVAWAPGASNGRASGTLTIANAIPVAGDKFTIGGQDFIFRAPADADTEFEVPIGVDLATTMSNLSDAINASDFLNDDIGAVNAGAVVTVTASGAAGNTVTLAKTFATGANGTVSGATLTGGTDAGDGHGNTGASIPYGILPHALDTSATGSNADTPCSVFITGDPSFDALALPEGVTYLEIKAAFAGTGINVQQLY